MVGNVSFIDLMVLTSSSSYFNPGLFNTWHKLVRYSHHHNFLSLCVANNRLPKGLLLKFDSQLVKKNTELKDSINSDLRNASFEIIKKIKKPTFSEVKTMKQNLQLEGNKLFQNFDSYFANCVWNETKRAMNAFKHELERREKKLSKTILLFQEAKSTIEVRKQPNRQFLRPNRRRSNSVFNVQSARAENNMHTEELLDLNPINLASKELTEVEQRVLSKGPSFCPVPKDTNWQKVHESFDQFDRRIRMAAYFHQKKTSDENKTNSNFQLSKPQNKWNPPKACPELELFLSNIRKDVLDLRNIRKPKDNLSKEEREAIKNLKSDDRIIRIQDKGSRFVVVDKDDYQFKMLSPLDNSLHYAQLSKDLSFHHLQKINVWAEKWLREGQVSGEVAL